MEIHESKDLVGQKVAISDWLPIDQRRINVFAECTEDRQWIQTDVKRSCEDNPFGPPVAHRYLRLSLLTHFHEKCERFPEYGTKAWPIVFNNKVEVQGKAGPEITADNVLTLFEK